MADEVRVTYDGQERRAMLVQGGATGVQTQGPAADDAAATGNPVPVGGIYNTTLPTYTALDRTQVQSDVRGNLRALLVGSTASATDGASNTLAFPTAHDNNVSVAQRLLAIAGFEYNGTTWDRQRKPSGASRILSAAASTNATVAKASAGDLHKVIGTSARGSICFLKIYNKATAPTVGTDTPILTVAIPANASFDLDFKGLYFSAGISYAFTTAGADADTGALTAADIVGFNLTYA